MNRQDFVNNKLKQYIAKSDKNKSQKLKKNINCFKIFLFNLKNKRNYNNVNANLRLLQQMNIQSRQLNESQKNKN